LAKDRCIPGTLNVGNAIPDVAAFVAFLVFRQEWLHGSPGEVSTLVHVVLAAGAGAWLGAGIVARLPQRGVQIVLGVLLFGVASFACLRLRGPESMPYYSHNGLWGTELALPVLFSTALGALMASGLETSLALVLIPSVASVYGHGTLNLTLLGCAALARVAAGVRFLRRERVDHATALGLAFGGLVAVAVVYVLEKCDVEVPTTARLLGVALAIYTGARLLLAARGRAAADGT
jgi:hypothetical protein